MGVDLTWQFPYSDAMFSHSSEEYDHLLAQVSLGLALSSFRIERVVRPEEERERNAISYLSKAGFTDFESADYDQIPSLQTVSSVLCRKEMTDEQGPYTLVVVGVSGCGYALEWLSNFTVGISARHEGFSRAAQNVEGRNLCLPGGARNHRPNETVDYRLQPCGRHQQYCRCSSTSRSSVRTKPYIRNTFRKSSST